MTIGFASDGEARHGMVIELVESGSLRDLLDSAAALSWRYPLLGIAHSAARGMAYLHDRKATAAVKAPSCWYHSSLAWPPGADPPGPWRRHALATSR